MPKKQRDRIIAFNKRGFEGVHIGVLELSSAQIDDIVRCSWAHATARLGNENVMLPPILYWHDGFLICTCLVHGTLDKTALTLHFPFLCYSRMPVFRDMIPVPNMRPETHIPIIKVVPKLLRDVFEDILEKDIEKEAKRSG